MKPFLAAAALALLTAPSSHATPDQDDALYDAMRHVGVALNYRAVPAAYSVCAEAWSGTDPDYIAWEILDTNPTWGLDRAQTFVAVSIMIYCPPTGRSNNTRGLR